MLDDWKDNVELDGCENFRVNIFNVILDQLNIDLRKR